MGGYLLVLKRSIRNLLFCCHSNDSLWIDVVNFFENGSVEKILKDFYVFNLSRLKHGQPTGLISNNICPSLGIRKVRF